MSLTGAKIEILLEQQYLGCPKGHDSNRILQVSNGFTYSLITDGPACDKVNPADIKWNGIAIDPSQTYRVTVNSFLADGGDLFTILTQGTNRLGGAVDLDAFEVYLTAFSPVAPGPQDRITLWQ
jgi:5'-nucleotidase